MIFLSSTIERKMNGLEEERKKSQTEEEQLELLYLGLKEMIHFEKEPENLFLRKLYGMNVSNEDLKYETERVLNDEKSSFFEKDVAVLLANVFPILSAQESKHYLQFGSEYITYILYDILFEEWVDFYNRRYSHLDPELYLHPTSAILESLKLKCNNLESNTNHHNDQKECNLILRMLSVRDPKSAEKIYTRFPCKTTAIILLHNLIRNHIWERVAEISTKHDINISYKENMSVYWKCRLLLLDNYNLRKKLEKSEGIIKELGDVIRELETQIRYSPDGEGAREAKEEFEQLARK